MMPYSAALATRKGTSLLTTTRWVDLNSGEVVGNAIVIAAWTGDTTPEDQFKIEKLDLCVRVANRFAKRSAARCCAIAMRTAT
jgi:hypothetical protein